MTQREYDVRMMEIEIMREEYLADVSERQEEIACHEHGIAVLHKHIAHLDLEALKLRVEMTKQLMEEEK